MVLELANASLALRTYLRESITLIHADYLGSAQKIIISLPKNKDGSVSITVPPFQNLLVIQPGRGGRGNIGLAQQEERMDIFCYGTDDVQSRKIFRALDAYIYPDSIGLRVKTSFTRNNCQVNWCMREGGPNTLVEPTLADWPYTIATYIVNFNGQIRP